MGVKRSADVRLTRTHTQPYKSDTKKSIQLALLIRPLPFLHSCGAVVMEACWVGIGNTLSLSGWARARRQRGTESSVLFPGCDRGIIAASLFSAARGICRVEEEMAGWKFNFIAWCKNAEETCRRSSSAITFSFMCVMGRDRLRYTHFGWRNWNWIAGIYNRWDAAAAAARSALSLAAHEM